jgi:hypothetical protein
MKFGHNLRLKTNGWETNPSMHLKSKKERLKII